MPDENNEWMIETKNQYRKALLENEARVVKDGDIVRLYHKSTGKYLHVNKVRPPISEHDYSNEVSCNATRGLLGDADYEFKVRMLLKKSHATLDLPLIKLRATESIFQLIHQGTKCVVMTHDIKLPSWGSNQREVLCVEEPTIPNTLWYVEYNSHPALDESDQAEKVNFQSVSFWRKFKEYHRAVFRINNSFTDPHSYSSTPQSWPLLLRGVNYYGNDAAEKKLENGSHIYFLGNLAVYYFSFTVVLVMFFSYALYSFRHMNPFAIQKESIDTVVFYDHGLEYTLGWLIHYFPYFLMSRQLFLHHYLPSLYFGILLIGQFVEYQISKRKVLGYLTMTLITITSLYCFISFYPLIYGTPWTIKDCNHAKWFSGWDFNCMNYSS